MRRDVLLAIPAVIVAGLLPLFLGNFTLRTATDILIYAILASSWNIIGGYTGYASFGNVVFFGTGAYAAGIAMTVLGLGFFPALLLGGLASGGFGFLVGLPILRLKGHYFAIATLGLAEATKALVQNLAITEGNSGMYLPIPRFQRRCELPLLLLHRPGGAPSAAVRHPGNDEEQVRLRVDRYPRG